MPSIKTLPEFRRPREKLIEQGPDALTDGELIAILIRTGTTQKSAIQIGRDLAKKYTLTQLLDLPTDQLADHPGLGRAKAATIKAGLILGYRATQTDPPKLIIDHPDKIWQTCQGLGSKKREHLVVLYLDARNQLISKQTISIGTLTDSLVHPREVFAPALELRAVNLILVHNHPSGDTEPSQADLSLTLRIAQAGQLLGISLLDHVIITTNDYFSLKQTGHWDELIAPGYE